MKKHLPKYRRRPDRNYAFVEHDGRRIRLPGRYGSLQSRRAYTDFLAALPGAESTPIVGEATVGELASAYLLYAKRHYRDADKVRGSRESGHFRSILDALVSAGAANVAVSAFGPKRLREVREAFIARGWSRCYVNAQTSRLRRIFKWGVGQEMLSPEVAAALTFVEPLREGRTPAPEMDPIEPVDKSVVLEVASHAGPVVAAMMRLHALTGMRPQNICNITPGQIDRTGDIWLFRPTTHKTAWRSTRITIPLGPQAQAILQPFLDRPADKPCFSPRESEEARTSGYLERKSRNAREAYDTATYGRTIKWAIRRANKARFRCLKPIESFAPNQIRHAFATEVRRISGLEAAQVLLGHTSADTTQIYAERNLELAVRIAQQIG